MEPSQHQPDTYVGIQAAKKRQQKFFDNAAKDLTPLRPGDRCMNVLVLEQKPRLTKVRNIVKSTPLIGIQKRVKSARMLEMESTSSRTRAQQRSPANQSSQVFSPNSSQQRFIQLGQQAFVLVSSALEHDENNKPHLALQSYEKGVRLLKEALAINLPTEQASKEHAQREKMISTLAHAQSRVNELVSFQQDTRLPLRQTSLPSYEEASSPSSQESDVTSCNADVLLEIASSQVYFITPEGYVSTPSYPSPLKICRFIEQTVPGAPKHFLQIGTFALPLVEDITPSLQMQNGAYIFPDVTSTQPGAAVGIILDDSISSGDVEVFEHLIAELSAFRSSSEALPIASDTASSSTDISASATAASSPCDTRQALAPSSQLPVDSCGQPSHEKDGSMAANTTPRVSTRLGKGLTTAAEWMSWGLGKGAEQVGGLIKYGGEKIRANMSSDNEEKSVDESHKRRVMQARYVTDKAVRMSSAAGNALGEMTFKLAQHTAPFIKSQVKKVVPDRVTVKVTSKDESGRSKMDDVKEVAAAGIKGFGIIYISLEEAGKALGRVLASQTSSTMTHKYGSEYGEVTEHAMYAVGNTLLSAHNVKCLGPKSIAKRAAKDTAKVMVQEKDDRAVPTTIEITDVTDEYAGT
ncbi:spartin-like [Watersipora subatra]|uniref:spartin-like n=1 Tax=Watersipora subatra TaxID=2589382 RepID=UPI00355B0B89